MDWCALCKLLRTIALTLVISKMGHLIDLAWRSIS
jgi:hypothetical protein